MIRDEVPNGLATVQEAATYLSLSKSKLYELMEQGDLEYVKIDRARRIPWKSIVQLVEQRLVGGWRQGRDAS